MLANGRYTIFRNGVACTVAVAAARGELAAIKGKPILSLQMTDGKWRSFAFLNDDNSVQFFKRFSAENSKKVLETIRQAVAAIAMDPQEATDNYLTLAVQTGELKT